MASNVARCFFLMLCLMMIQACVRGRSIKPDETKPAAEPEKVPMTLYYEALCPGCANFVVKGLSPVLYNGLIDTVDLKLVPWGNAEVIQPNKSFACQHGPRECMLNTVESCIIDTWPSALEQKYADETKAQKVQFVPWVIVNGQPLKEDYSNFVKYICKTYKRDATESMHR